MTRQQKKTEDQIRDGKEQRGVALETYLKFERLYIIGAWREVSVDQSATAERSAEGVLLQSHAIPLAVPTVQALSVTI